MKSDKVKIRYSGIPEVLVRISMPDPKVKVMKLKKLVRRKKKRKKNESVDMNNGIDNDDESEDKKRTMEKSSQTKLMVRIKILASLLICNGVTLSDAVPLNSRSETEDASKPTELIDTYAIQDRALPELIPVETIFDTTNSDVGMLDGPTAMAGNCGSLLGPL